MRYAIISDIHSNLESFTAFLEMIPQQRIEKIVCLGDIVGYNANPNECSKILSMLDNIEIIRGNHDRAFIKKDYGYFSDHAKKAIIWTIKNANEETRNFIKKIEPGPKIIDDLFAICHGSLIDEDDYIFTKASAKMDFKMLQETGVNFSFFGHTHWQNVYKMDSAGKVEEIKSKKIKISKNDYYLLNPGSIGQPRDKDPRASFMVFDSDEMSAEVIRFHYSFQTTQRKIIENKLPQFLAERLAYGV